MTLPEGINPSVVPDLERLDALTEAEIFACIQHWTKQNFTRVSAQFWIDELSRRRTAAVLEQIAEATRENAWHVAEVAKLIEAGAEQNAEMVKLNRQMRWLTASSVALAAAAVIVALLSQG